MDTKTMKPKLCLSKEQMKELEFIKLNKLPIDQKIKKLTLDSMVKHLKSKIYNALKNIQCGEVDSWRHQVYSDTSIKDYDLRLRQMKSYADFGGFQREQITYLVTLLKTLSDDLSYVLMVLLPETLLLLVVLLADVSSENAMLYLRAGIVGETRPTLTDFGLSSVERILPEKPTTKAEKPLIPIFTGKSQTTVKISWHLAELNAISKNTNHSTKSNKSVTDENKFAEVKAGPCSILKMIQNNGTNHNKNATNDSNCIKLYKKTEINKQNESNSGNTEETNTIDLTVKDVTSLAKNISEITNNAKNLNNKDIPSSEEKNSGIISENNSIDRSSNKLLSFKSPTYEADLETDFAIQNIDTISKDKLPLSSSDEWPISKDSIINEVKINKTSIDVTAQDIITSIENQINDSAPKDQIAADSDEKIIATPTKLFDAVQNSVTGAIELTLDVTNDDGSRNVLLCSVAEAENCIGLHEHQFTLKYCVQTKKGTFGKADIYAEGHRIYWEDDQMAFRGVPFCILSHKTLDCQYGKDRNISSKVKNHLHRRSNGKRQRELQNPTKKCGCPASIMIKEIVFFPQHHVSPVYYGKHKRREVSKKIRDAIAAKEAMMIDVRYLVMLPSVDVHAANHPVGDAAGAVQPIDKLLLKYLQQIVQMGVSSLDETMRHLRLAVKNNIFQLPFVPAETNRRFYPHRKCVQRHLNVALQQKNAATDEVEEPKAKKSTFPRHIGKACRNVLGEIEKLTYTLEEYDEDYELMSAYKKLKEVMDALKKKAQAAEEKHERRLEAVKMAQTVNAATASSSDHNNGDRETVEICDILAQLNSRNRLSAYMDT